MKTALFLIPALLFSVNLLASEKEPSLQEIKAIMVDQGQKIDQLTAQIARLTPAPVAIPEVVERSTFNTTMDYAVVIVPAVGVGLVVGYTFGIFRPIMTLAYAGYEATKMVADLKGMVIQLNSTLQMASQLVPTKEQALPALKELGKRMFGL